LSHVTQLPIIYLALTSPSASIDLPSGIERATLNVQDILRYTWSFSA